MDSAVLALVPALIIGMVVSLLYFLVLAFYRGDFDARLMYLLTLFSIATVLIATIAIESGRAHANLFSLPLGLASYFAISKFVTASGPLAPLSWLINLLLLALAWWLADRITMDCAVFDSRQAGSRQGLLQSLGLVRRHAPLTEKPLDEVRIDAAGKSTTIKARKHNQGVWVLYFALLALPLFGIGQLVLPEQSINSGFMALIVYLGCSMSLLTSTSFLTMRRYVRQKGLEMPTELSRSWIGSAVLAVSALLFICLILPLPGRNLGLVELPFIESPENLSTNRWGWGKEGKKNESTDESGGNAIQSDDQDAPPTGPPNSDESEQAAGNSKDGKQSSQSSDKQGKSNRSNSSDEAGKNQDSNENQNPSKNQNARKSDSQQDSSNSSKQDSSPDSNQESRDPSNPDNSPGDEQDTDADSQSPASDAQESDTQESNTEESSDTGSSKPLQSQSKSPPNFSFSLPTNLGEVFKWLTFIVLAIVVIGYAVTHPGEIRQLWQQIKHFFSSLFGRKPDPAEKPSLTAAASEPTIPMRRFAEFENPFRSAGNWSPEQIVKHSYAALQAWGAEHNAKCNPDWTASEYARHLARHSPEISKHSQVVAKLFDRVMFGDWTPRDRDAQQLRALWDLMSRS